MAKRTEYLVVQYARDGSIIKQLRAPKSVNLEFPRFDGHFFTDEGECFSCRERGTRTLRNSGIR